MNWPVLVYGPMNEWEIAYLATWALILGAIALGELRRALATRRERRLARRMALTVDNMRAFILGAVNQDRGQ